MLRSTVSFILVVSLACAGGGGHGRASRPIAYESDFTIRSSRDANRTPVKALDESSEFSAAPVERVVYRPEYPENARRTQVEGTVVAKAFLNEIGDVVRVEILESPSIILNKTVREALLTSKFFPAKKDGVPVPCTLIVPFDFYLRM